MGRLVNETFDQLHEPALEDNETLEIKLVGIILWVWIKFNIFTILPM